MTNVTVTSQDVPKPTQSNAERQRKYRAKNPEKAARNKTKYRRDNSKWETDKSYLSRQFCAWDGEGITREDGSHDYTLLTGFTKDDEVVIETEGRLGSFEIFDTITTFARKHNTKIHVIYGGSYDFNMWLVDLPRKDLETLYSNGAVRWQGFRLMWRKGKSFYIGKIGANGKTEYGVTMYDVVSFFQTSFVNACDSYLGEAFYMREMIVANKAKRGSFQQEDAEQTKEYNRAELINLIRLMEELRARLNKAGLRPRRWDGPGAVAAALLKREGVQKAQTECPEEVQTAARTAYAGGRFEVIKFGSVREKAWEYDVNSAYPTALRKVPDLTIGEWRYVEGDPGDKPFAIYNVRYRGNRADLPGAFFCRAENGSVSYPMNVTGWYWSPEIEVARKYCDDGYGTMDILGAWVYDYPEHRKPFHFIDKLYRARQIYKAQGDGAHVGIKLGLNSLYGKLAQQVGARYENGEWKLPPFHQIEWAGYVTAYCRASVLNACLPNLESVIAFETDAVFTSAPLDVEEGTELGQFESVEFSRLTYVQSGVYFGESDGKMIEKTRGVDRGQLKERGVLKRLRREAAKERYADATLTRFVTLGVALTQTFTRWQRWETVHKRITLEPTGKRIHLSCACFASSHGGLTLGMWHRTACPIMAAVESKEFPVLWKNPDPNMEVLAELREYVTEYNE